MSDSFDLSDFPTFFGGKTVKIVVGAKAPTSDVVGAIDIGAIVFGIPNGVASGLAVLDTEIGDNYKDENIISVGSPSENLVSAKLLGFDTLISGEQLKELGFVKGKATIKVVDSNNEKIHILVTGLTASDVLGACYILSDYATYNLTGKEVDVIVADLNAIDITNKVLPSLKIRQINTKMMSLQQEIKETYEQKLYHGCIILSASLIEITLKIAILEHVTSDKDTPELADQIIDKALLSDLIRTYVKKINTTPLSRKLLTFVMEIRNHLVHSTQHNQEYIKEIYRKSGLSLGDYDLLNDDEKLKLIAYHCATISIGFSENY